MSPEQDIAETLKEALETDIRNPATTLVARRLVKRVSGYGADLPCLRHVVGHLSKKIRYVREAPDIAWAPVDTLLMGAGDCDDAVRLVGALLASLGFEVRVATAHTSGGDYHVWLFVDSPDLRAGPVEVDLASPRGPFVSPVDVDDSIAEYYLTQPVG
jgi:hypothetical protein